MNKKPSYKLFGSASSVQLPVPEDDLLPLFPSKNADLVMTEEKPRFTIENQKAYRSAQLAYAFQPLVTAKGAFELYENMSMWNSANFKALRAFVSSPIYYDLENMPTNFVFKQSYVKDTVTRPFFSDMRIIDKLAPVIQTSLQNISEAAYRRAAQAGQMNNFTVKIFDKVYLDLVNETAFHTLFLEVYVRVAALTSSDVTIVDFGGDISMDLRTYGRDAIMSLNQAHSIASQYALRFFSLSFEDDTMRAILQPNADVFRHFKLYERIGEITTKANALMKTSDKRIFRDRPKSLDVPGSDGLNAFLGKFMPFARLREMVLSSFYATELLAVHGMLLKLLDDPSQIEQYLEPQPTLIAAGMSSILDFSNLHHQQHLVVNPVDGTLPVAPLTTVRQLNFESDNSCTITSLINDFLDLCAANPKASKFKLPLPFAGVHMATPFTTNDTVRTTSANGLFMLEALGESSPYYESLNAIYVSSTINSVFRTNRHLTHPTLDKCSKELSCSVNPSDVAGALACYIGKGVTFSSILIFKEAISLAHSGLAVVTKTAKVIGALPVMRTLDPIFESKGFNRLMDLNGIDLDTEHDDFASICVQDFGLALLDFTYTKQHTILSGFEGVAPQIISHSWFAVMDFNLASVKYKDILPVLESPSKKGQFPSFEAVSFNEFKYKPDLDLSYPYAKLAYLIHSMRLSTSSHTFFIKVPFPVTKCDFLVLDFLARDYSLSFDVFSPFYYHEEFFYLRIFYKVQKKCSLRLSLLPTIDFVSFIRPQILRFYLGVFVRHFRFTDYPNIRESVYQTLRTVRLRIILQKMGYTVLPSIMSLLATATLDVGDRIDYTDPLYMQHPRLFINMVHGDINDREKARRIKSRMRRGEGNKKLRSVQLNQIKSILGAGI